MSFLGPGLGYVSSAGSPKKKSMKLPLKVPLRAKLSLFARVAVIRPFHILFAKLILTFSCLYVAVNFGILFSFFAGVPHTFGLFKYVLSVYACFLPHFMFSQGRVKLMCERLVMHEYISQLHMITSMTTLFLRNSLHSIAKSRFSY